MDRLGMPILEERNDEVRQEGFVIDSRPVNRFKQREEVMLLD
jgi:hypothetical protein